MSRQDSVWGLSKEAQIFLKRNVKSDIKSRPQLCSDCLKLIRNAGYKLAINEKKIHKKIYGIYELHGYSGHQYIDLHEYKLKDGRTIREVVQTIQYSSGTQLFLCLKDKKTNKILFPWTQHQINSS